MTEPENFEEDLFADLYEDNDASKAAPPPKAAAPAIPEPQPIHPGANDQPGTSYDHDIGGDENMNQDLDDDDDDVDFNLGGGGMSNSMNHASAPEDVPTPPPYGTVHKASAKEDG